MTDATSIKNQNNIERIAGAILANKPLNPPTKFKNPCSICNKNVLSNQAGIICDLCEKWCHIKCDDDTSVELYNFHINNPEAKWFCLFCKVKMNKENLPFTLSNSSELANITLLPIFRNWKLKRILTYFTPIRLFISFLNVFQNIFCLSSQLDNLNTIPTRGYGAQTKFFL